MITKLRIADTDKTATYGAGCVSRVTSGQPMVSLLVCLRDCAKKLPAFLESIAAQTIWRLGCIQLVLLDLTSLDRTHAICAQFQRQYADYVVLHRTSNTDCTDAVRVGLVFASGKYVSFACADSIFEPKHYETLCFCAVKSDAQVVEIGGERTLLQMIREPQRIDPMGKLIDRAFLADRQIFDQQDFQPHAAYFFARCVAFADRLAFADIPFPPCQTETPVTLDFCAALLRLTQTQDINQLANAWIAVLQDEILRLYTQTRGGKAFFERMIALADKDIMRQILRYADKTTEIGAFVRQRDWISLENCIKKQRAMQLAKRMLKKGR